MDIQDWFPLGWTDWVSLQSKGLSWVFSNTTVRKHQFFGTQLLYGPNFPSLHDSWENHRFDCMDLCWQSDVYAFNNAVEVCHSFSSKEQVSFNFMAAFFIHSDFGAQNNKVCHCFHCFCIYLPWSDGTWCRDLSFLNVESSDRCGLLEKGMANHPQYSCLENPMHSMKGKMIGHWKMNSPGQKVPIMLVEISGEITPERMKGWSQSKNNAQLWTGLVIEARSYAVKAISHRNLECQVHESRQIGSGQTGDGKSECRYSRNQWTKMDWNGWI